MYCSKQNSLVIILWNSVIMMIGFLLVQVLWYGVKDMASFSLDWKQLCVTFMLAVVYAHFYNKMSRSWRFTSRRGFLHRSDPDGSHFCGINLPNLSNALVFGLFMAVIICLVMTMAGVLFSTVYVHLLEGIRGAVPPGDEESAIAVGTQVIVGTAGTELFGKTEERPRN